MLFIIGCRASRESEPPLPPQGPGRASAIQEAKRLLASTDLTAKQACIDALVGLGEDARPGLEELLHGCLARSLDGRGGARPQGRLDAYDMELLLRRFTWPSLPWPSLGFALEGRHPAPPRRSTWLLPFIAKVYKHNFVRDRRFAAWMLLFHAPHDALALDDAAHDRDPLVRAYVFHLFTKLTDLPRSAVEPALRDALKWDEDPVARTSALWAAAELKLPSLLSALSRLLDDDTPVLDPADYGNAEVYCGVDHAREERQEKHFRATIGQLAAYAIQETTGEDFGFRSCCESREDMPQIAQRMRDWLSKQRESSRSRRPRHYGW